MTTATTLTQEREELRAEGREVFVDVNLECMGSKAADEWQIPCSLCSAPATFTASLEQEAGKCLLHIAQPDERYDGCSCYAPHRHIERYVCRNCMRRHTLTLGAALTDIRESLEVMRDADPALRDRAKQYIADGMQAVKKEAPPLLRALGDDDATIDEALDNYTVFLAAEVTGVTHVS